MGHAAKVIALDDVRASQQWQSLRQQRHERFDRWLDEAHSLQAHQIVNPNVRQKRLS